jgi:hypothetical protein
MAAKAGDKKSNLGLAGGAAAGAAVGSLLGPLGAAVGAVVGGIAGGRPPIARQRERQRPAPR